MSLLALRALATLAALAYVYAMSQDLLYRKIPNLVPLALVAIAALKWLAIGQLSPALWAIAISGVVFLIAAAMFAFNWLGAGDVKLVASSCLLLGFDDTSKFLAFMAVIGGVLSIVVLAQSYVLRRRARAAVADPATQADTKKTPLTVPYGVAIGASAMWLLFLQTYSG